MRKYIGIFEYGGIIEYTPLFWDEETVKDYVFVFGPTWDIQGKLLHIIEFKNV